MSVAWRCSVCDSVEVRVVPSGGPFGSPSRPVSGVWVSCLSCFRWVFRPFAFPVPLSAILPFCGVFRQEEPSPEAVQAPASKVIKYLGYEVEESTGEILDKPQPSLASKVLDGVLGPKATARGRMAQKIYNTPKLSGWKQAIVATIAASVIIFILLVGAGVIETPYDSRLEPGHTSYTEWVPGQGWQSYSGEKGGE